MLGSVKLNDFPTTGLGTANRISHGLCDNDEGRADIAVHTLSGANRHGNFVVQEGILITLHARYHPDLIIHCRIESPDASPGEDSTLLPDRGGDWGTPRTYRP